MTDLMKPIIFGALIIAVGVFLAAQRIAYVVSFEGRWDSCVKTFNNDATRKAMGLPTSPADPPGERLCFSLQSRGSGN